MFKSPVLGFIMLLSFSAGFVYSKPSKASMSCQSILKNTSYKPKRVFTTTELKAFDRLAVGLLAVRIFRGEIEGLQRKQFERVSEVNLSGVNLNQLARELHLDLLKLLSGEKVPVRPYLRPFLVEGFENSFLRQRFNALLARTPLQATQNPYSSLNELNNIVRTNPDSLNDFREYLKANLPFIIESALRIKKNNKPLSYAKYSLYSGLLSMIPIGLDQILAGSIYPLEFSIKSITAGLLLGGVLLIDKYRRTLFLPIPSLSAPLTNNDSSNSQRARFTRQDE